jgi:two-component system, LytTR family, response regulator
MRPQFHTNNITTRNYLPEPLDAGETVTALEKEDQFRNFLQQIQLSGLNDLLAKLAQPAGKKSFLVFKHNKYINVLTENIAFFYVKYESSIITCFDRQEYLVNHSLEQIQNVLTTNQFFRINRQYLINFNAVKDVERYFARKLLVHLVIPSKDKLLISKEKVTSFLRWLDNR